ncbi:MAG: serine O-acetyltransferase [Anaerolineae bacterium]|nr:serine O-acetyltransferase [Anaerolineae bacterium]
MIERMREDIRSVLERDPAAYSPLQIALTYPGIQAVWMHRIANSLWRADMRLLAMMVARLSRWLTGIEIHPAAQIGRRLFIDHGMGVVIGETAEIGSDVTIYHGVTLGGVSLAHGKRHPTLEDGVVVGAGAKVLGAITIGSCTRIGANAVVVKDVEANMVVVGIPGKPVAREGKPIDVRHPDLEHGKLPDVLSERLDRVLDRLDRIDGTLAALTEGERDLMVAELRFAEPDYAI